MSGSYTERFTECNILLDALDIRSHAGGESTEWVAMTNYHRGVVMVFTGALTGTLDVALWQATNAAGAGAKVVAGKAITQLAATDDYEQAIIEFKTEELDVDGGFDYVRAQTLNGAANVYGVYVFGSIPRFAPGTTGGWDEIVD
jgi:hypothetical protein